MKTILSLSNPAEVETECLVAIVLDKAEKNRTDKDKSPEKDKPQLSIETSDAAGVVKGLRDTAMQLLELTPGTPEELRPVLMNIEEPGQLADFVANFLNIELSEKQALLEELSPDRIERLLKEEPAEGIGTLLGRYRALWRTFERHYEELTNQARTFELVFGADFAASYREYLGRQKRTTK